MNKALRSVPLWLSLLGVVPVIATALLGARLVWEQTVWSVASGPQMVGFSLAHSDTALLFVAPIVGAPWALATLVVILWRRAWHERLPVLLLLLFSVSAAALSVPYGIWQRILVSAHARGPHAGKFVSYAAATGDLGTVKAFLEQGVSVNVHTQSNGATPLHGAAVEGQLEVIEYLISKGADVNALNAYGDSPMENARSMNHPEAMRLLERHGGRVIRGTDEQRNRAIEEEVERDMRRVDAQP